MSDWKVLLDEAIRKSNRQVVADELGYSRTAVSLIMSGKYGGKTEKFAARVIEVYGDVACPHLMVTISRPACKEVACSKPPTHNPAKMAHWRACRRCPHKPETEGEEK